MIVEIRPGEGGEDAENFAHELAVKIIMWLSKDGHNVVMDPSGAPRIYVLKAREPVPG